MAIEASRATLDQRNIGSQAHLVDMSPRIQVIQRIENDLEGPKPRHIELRIFDVVMVRLDVDVGVEASRGVFCNLYFGLAHTKPWYSELIAPYQCF